MADQPIEGRFAGTEHRFPVRGYFENTGLSGAYAVSRLDIRYRAPAGLDDALWLGRGSSRFVQHRSIFITESCADRRY